jgi:hypothetical protein
VGEEIPVPLETIVLLGVTDFKHNNRMKVPNCQLIWDLLGLRKVRGELVLNDDSNTKNRGVKKDVNNKS